MTFFTMSALALAIAYLYGSIPTGYLAGRLRGIDIREHGSKSTGATNVLRTLGKLPALVVLFVDVLKGVAAVATAAWILGISRTSPIESSATAVSEQWLPWILAAAGLFAILGHARSMWLGFSGGKSAATGLGVLLAISWPIGLGAAATFVLVVAATRIVSLSSMLGAVTASAVALGTEQPMPYQLLAAAGSAYVIVRHRTNIKRLLQGTEPRIDQSQGSEQREHAGR